jgi:RNA polymerase sigma-70 factor (ECF subfamily)
MKHLSEEQIWKAFKDGNDEALSFIYYHYAPKLYNYGRQFCAEADQVKDAIQDLFCEMIQSRGRLGDTTSIKFYLYASLKRKLMRVQERQQKQFAFVGLEGGFELNISDGNDLFNQIFSADTSQIIKKHVQSFPKNNEKLLLYTFLKD